MRKKALRQLYVVAAAACAVFVPAQAQWDAYWNESGPAPQSCLFNGEEFYVDDDVCVGAGVKQVCLADGTLSASTKDDDCTGASVARPSITKSHHHQGTSCSFDQSRFSVGAEICVAPGRKQICQADGSLAQAIVEPSCRSAVIGAGG